MVVEEPRLHQRLHQWLHQWLQVRVQEQAHLQRLCHSLLAVVDQQVEQWLEQWLEEGALAAESSMEEWAQKLVFPEWVQAQACLHKLLLPCPFLPSRG